MTNIYLAQNSMRSNRKSSMVSKSFAKFTDQNGSLAKVFNTTKTYLKSQTLWRLSINMKFWCSKWMKNLVEVNFDDANQHALLETLCLYTRKIWHTNIYRSKHKFPSLKTSHTNIHRSKYQMQASMPWLDALVSTAVIAFGDFLMAFSPIFMSKLIEHLTNVLDQKSIDVSFWVRVYELCYFDAKWCTKLL